MKENRSSGLIRPHYDKLMALVRIVDSAAITISLWLMILCLRNFQDPSYTWNDMYTAYAFGGVVLYQFFADYNEVYNAWRGSPVIKELARLFWSWIFAATTLIVIGYFLKVGNASSRLVIMTWVISSCVLLAFLHGFGNYLLGYVRAKGRNSRRAVIVGANELGQRLASAFNTMPWLGYHFQGYYDDRTFTEERRLACPDDMVCGSLSDLLEDARSSIIDDIFITLPMRSEKRIISQLNLLSDTTASVYYVPDVFVFNLVNSRVDTIQGIPCLSVYDSPFNSQPIDSLIKRTEDIILSLMILAVLAVPMALIGIGVKLTSSGPAIFRQKRYGIHGEAIEVWKFRTMTVQENGDTVLQAKRSDPRVTRFGAFLRKYSLDELPQFINVLQGTMSIVGPRPHAIAHNEYYRKLIQGYMLRHTIKPGITGLAQIRGCRGETDTVAKMEQRVLYDLEYIRNWRFFLDLKIIFTTIFKIAHDPSAY